jgi:hypothetical protein
MTDLYTHFSEDEEQSWLDALPNYQKEIVSELLSVHNHEEAVSSWLEASIGNTSPFSGQTQPKMKYSIMFKKEVHKLLCGNSEYITERDELTQLFHKPDNKTAIISWVSAIIGAKVGLAATFVAPAIVIIFIMIAKTSLNAWCALQTTESEE